ncbi:MAG: c-type cytochrome [Alcaligenaceae bacterium]|nr:c-type cytochrome [Alcaligenaceae bacterium]
MATNNREKLYKLFWGVVLGGFFGFVLLTSPWVWSVFNSGRTLPDLESADLEIGRHVFVASNCATCHQTPGQNDDTLLGGGRAQETAFGVFHMPNISPDPKNGIGNWTLEQFDRAVREGVGPGGVWPDGKNLYPAFPYTSYKHLSGEDVRNLYAYMMSLPPVENAVPHHELKFPYNMRRGVGLWRLAFLDGKRDLPASIPAGVDTDQYIRGAYLVEGAGHCAECHSPRGFMGDVVNDLRYGGGPSADGITHVANITPSEVGIGYWSVAAIANYLKTGVNPIGRASDGDMAKVIENTSQLPFEDLQAMALYLKHIPAVDKAAPGMPEPNWTDQLVMLPQTVEVRADMPTSPASEIRQGSTVAVVATKNAWLDAGHVGGAQPEEGKLLGGALATVLQQDGDRIQVLLKGWQQVDAPSVVYQAQGQRVMMAVLGDAAAEAAQRGAEVVDEETEQVWAPVELSLWTDSAELHTDRQALWDYSQVAYQRACAACHVLSQPANFTANQWIGTMRSMKRFTSLTDDQYRLMLSYLQNHSRDLNTQSGGL